MVASSGILPLVHGLEASLAGLQANRMWSSSTSRHILDEDTLVEAQRRCHPMRHTPWYVSQSMHGLLPIIFRHVLD